MRLKSGQWPVLLKQDTNLKGNQASNVYIYVDIYMGIGWFSNFGHWDAFMGTGNYLSLIDNLFRNF